MSRRVSPTEKIRSEIDALFDGERDLAAIVEDVARVGARLLLQTALEAEIDEFLGRSRYERAAGAVDAADPPSRSRPYAPCRTPGHRAAAAVHRACAVSLSS